MERLLQGPLGRQVGLGRHESEVGTILKDLASKLRGDDITVALNVIVCDTQMPAYKRKYLEKSGSVCPFCESKDMSSGPIQSDSPVAWSEVECEDCGASWQDMWSLVDITEAKGKDGKGIEGRTDRVSGRQLPSPSPCIAHRQ